jgi:hypothetical protein
MVRNILVDIFTGGESIYNEGKGISITLHFTPLVHQKAGGAKCRKNAAAPKTTSKILFVHEDMPFREFTTKIIITIKREDLFEGMQVTDGKITDTPYDLHYTIARTAYKNIELQTNADFAAMMAEVQSKLRPALVLTMAEKKVIMYVYYLLWIGLLCLDR